MNVNPGEFRHRITFVTETSGTDADGFPIPIETEIFSCQAKVHNTSGTEQIKAGAEITETKTRFLIRYPLVALKEDYQIKFNADYYDIKYMNDYEFKKEYMEIWAELRKQV